jgi:general secretion pathway protein L
LIEAILKRLFLTLPDPLPEGLTDIAWRMPPDSGMAADVAQLPAADEIWLVVPASRVLLSALTLSKRALRQLNGALGNALEDKLMLDPAQVHVALGKPEAGDVHPVAVIEIAWLEQALALCRRHGIEPLGAAPETLLWEAEVEPGHWSACWRDHQGYVRTGGSAGFALDDGDSATPPLALQLALAEARRRNAAPLGIALEAEPAVDAEAWSRSLDCPVRLLTLRADARAPAINLLQGPYASRRGGGWLAEVVSSANLARYRLAAGIALAALGVHVLGSLADWARLAQESRQLRAEMRQVFQETFPETQAIVDPSLQMQRQLADLRRARGFLETGDFLHALGAVAGQVGGVEGLSYDNSRLTLEQPRATDLDGLRVALGAQGYRVSDAGEPGQRTISLERSLP